MYDTNCDWSYTPHSTSFAYFKQKKCFDVIQVMYQKKRDTKELWINVIRVFKINIIVFTKQFDFDYMYNLLPDLTTILQR